MKNWNKPKRDFAVLAAASLMGLALVQFAMAEDVPYCYMVPKDPACAFVKSSSSRSGAWTIEKGSVEGVPAVKMDNRSADLVIVKKGLAKTFDEARAMCHRMAPAKFWDLPTRWEFVQMLNAGAVDPTVKTYAPNKGNLHPMWARFRDEKLNGQLATKLFAVQKGFWAGAPILLDISPASLAQAREQLAIVNRELAQESSRTSADAQRRLEKFERSTAQSLGTAIQNPPAMQKSQGESARQALLDIQKTTQSIIALFSNGYPVYCVSDQ